tara:strand:- start:1753 stop:1917 length:165 start_codon:yes stop_codon:yes gene_type:complete
LKCTECDGEIKIPEDAMKGELVTCSDCGESFELVKKGDKFDIINAQVEGEDWGE